MRVEHLKHNRPAEERAGGDARDRPIVEDALAEFINAWVTGRVPFPVVVA